MGRGLFEQELEAGAKRLRASGFSASPRAQLKRPRGKPRGYREPEAKIRGGTARLPQTPQQAVRLQPQDPRQKVGGGAMRGPPRQASGLLVAEGGRRVGCIFFWLCGDFLLFLQWKWAVWLVSVVQIPDYEHKSIEYRA